MSIHEDTIAVRKGENFDTAKVEHYLRAQLPELSGDPLEVRQFPTGASNLTYLLRIGNWEGVLRRPPLGPVAPRAHDMQRESALLTCIHPVFALAPRPYFFCGDTSIVGVPFYVMERHKGIIINDTFPAGIPAHAELCRHLSHLTVDTLVQIHSVDWRTAGLATFGHPEGFLERQVKSWIERYFRAQTDDIAEVEQLTRWLTEHIPASPPPTLIHNDFKLNNILLSRPDLQQAVAVLDWEMATIGDPLFDLAVSLSYWVIEDDPEEIQTSLPAVTTTPGFLSREEFMEAYAQKSGRDLASMNFYLAFAYFKLAVIIQQIYVRWKRGQTQDERFSTYGSHVQPMIAHAVKLAKK